MWKKIARSAEPLCKNMVFHKQNENNKMQKNEVSLIGRRMAKVEWMAKVEEDG